MDITQLTLHIVNLLIYLIVLVLSLYNFKLILNCSKSKLIKNPLLVRNLLTLILAVIFVILQLDWVINNHNQSVGNLTSYLWLVFDYFLASILLTDIFLLKIIIQWKTCDKSNKECNYDQTS